MTIAETFLKAGTRDRLIMAHDDANQAELSRLLGGPAWAELRALADKWLDGNHLSNRGPRNTIFVPGIMGSLLINRVLAGFWWFDVRSLDKLDKLGLDPDGVKDADGNTNIVPITADITYEPFLAAALAKPGIVHEIYPYDWRKSLEHAAAGFRKLVLELHQENEGNPVHVVAHSMGGLVVRAALMQYGAELWPRIDKIVFIGTPHYGATAIAGYLKNHLWGFELMALLGKYITRPTLRSLWGMLNLLPAPREVYPGTRPPPDPHPWNSPAPDDPYIHPCVNFDLYKADNWQLGLNAGETANLQKILNATAEFHRRMYEAHIKLDQKQRDKMVVIAGVGFKTLFRLSYVQRFFGLWEKAEKTFDRVLDNPHRDGDGRVPLASAMLENIGDTRYVQGVHGGLTNLPAVYRDVFRYLKSEPMQLPDTVGGAMAGHLADPAESEAPHLDGSASVLPFLDDPGIWNLDDPSPERIAELDGMLEAGKLPDFARLHLL